MWNDHKTQIALPLYAVPEYLGSSNILLPSLCYSDHTYRDILMYMRGMARGADWLIMPAKYMNIAATNRVQRGADLAEEYKMMDFAPPLLNRPSWS